MIRPSYAPTVSLYVYHTSVFRAVRLTCSLISRDSSLVGGNSIISLTLHTLRSHFDLLVRQSRGTMATNLYSDGTSCGSVKADDSRRLCDISRCPGRTEWRGSEDLDVCDGGGTHESGRANSWPSWLSRYNLYGCADGVSGSTNRPRIEAEATWPSSDRQDDYPIQDRRVGQRALPIQIASEVPKYTVIGDAHLKIFKLSLPRHYHSLLRFILQGCISHAEKSSCGWM